MLDDKLDFAARSLKLQTGRVFCSTVSMQSVGGASGRDEQRRKGLTSPPILVGIIGVRGSRMWII